MKHLIEFSEAMLSIVVEAVLISILGLPLVLALQYNNIIWLLLYVGYSLPVIINRLVKLATQKRKHAAHKHGHTCHFGNDCVDREKCH